MIEMFTGPLNGLITLTLGLTPVLATFPLLGVFIREAPKLLDLVADGIHYVIARFARRPHRPFPDFLSPFVQCVFGAVFFCFFVFRLQGDQHWGPWGNAVAFLFIVLSCTTAAALGVWTAG